LYDSFFVIYIVICVHIHRGGQVIAKNVLSLQSMPGDGRIQGRRRVPPCRCVGDHKRGRPRFFQSDG